MTNPYRAMCAELADLLERSASVLSTYAFDKLASHGVAAAHRARALEYAIARWGHPTPQPVAVSERLPGPEDCDEQGRCWAWNSEAIWWELLRVKFLALNAGDPYTHWLPANALPTPDALDD